MVVKFWPALHVTPLSVNHPVELRDAEMGSIGLWGYEPDGRRVLVPWGSIRYVEIIDEP